MILQEFTDKQLGELRRYLLKNSEVGLVEKDKLTIEKLADACGSMPKRIKELEKGLLDKGPMRTTIRERYVAYIEKELKSLTGILAKSRKYRNLGKPAPEKKGAAIPAPAPAQARPTAFKRPSIQPAAKAPSAAPAAPATPAAPKKPKVKRERGPASEEFEINLHGIELTVRPGDIVIVKALPGKKIRIRLKE